MTQAQRQEFWKARREMREKQKSTTIANAPSVIQGSMPVPQTDSKTAA